MFEACLDHPRPSKNKYKANALLRENAVNGYTNKAIFTEIKNDRVVA